MPPPNDDFADAIAITLDPQTHPDETITGSNVGATQESPNECYWGIGSTVWWKWVATDNCRVRGDISGCDFSATAAVFTGTGPDCDDLDWVGNDAGLDWDDPIFKFTAVAGTTYYIQVDTWPSGEGNISIDLHAFDPNTPPAHDNIANAIEIVATPTVRTGSSGEWPIDACTLETGETSITNASHDSQMLKTMWWKWVADTSGLQTFTATNDIGSGLDVIIYWSPDGSTTFSQFQEYGFGEFGVAGANVFDGDTYYIAVGTDSSGTKGDITFNWSLGFYNYHVGECPSFVDYRGAGTWAHSEYPSLDNTQPPATMNDGYMPVYMPAYDDGDLGVILIACTGDGSTLDNGPSGWTKLFNDGFGGPKPVTYTGPNQHGQSPFDYDDANVAVWYKILDSAVDPDHGDLIHSFVGLEYNRTGDPPGEVGSAQAFVFSCVDSSEFEAVEWPDPPMIYAGKDDVAAEIRNPTISDPDVGNQQHNPDLNYYHTANFPVPVADAVGNHMYLAIPAFKGSYNVGMDFTATDNPDVGDPPSNFAGDWGWSFWEGAAAYLYLTDDVFGTIFDDPTTWMTDSYDLGTTSLNSPGSWSDGFLNPPGFATYDLIYGLAAMSVVVQAPESFFPPNDTSATAYVIPSCPARFIQCTLSARTEAPETMEGYSIGRDVWYKLTPATSETITITAHGSGFDPIMAIYDSGLTLIDSDNDSGPGFDAQIALAMTADNDYYIRVAGRDEGFGTLTLTVNCAGGIAPADIFDYWGILTEPL